MIIWKSDLDNTLDETSPTSTGELSLQGMTYLKEFT